MGKDQHSQSKEDSVCFGKQSPIENFQNNEAGEWTWNENNIKVFLEKRKKEVQLGIETGGIRRRILFFCYFPFLISGRQDLLMKRNGQLYPFARYIMLDFPIETLTRSSTSYIKTPRGYQPKCFSKNVNFPFFYIIFFFN